MDCARIGRLIAELRKEQKLTQKNIADALGIQSKTVSKWECGLGCPDLSLWSELSTILGVDMKQMMEGEITPNRPDSGNIDRVRFYICTTCGNILVSTGSASIFCCGRKLEQVMPIDSMDIPQITVEKVDIDYFITVDHPMTKENYLAFVSYVKSDRIYLHRLYPEQSPSFRFPMIVGGRLFIYSTKSGLMEYPHKLA